MKVGKKEAMLKWRKSFTRSEACGSAASGGGSIGIFRQDNTAPGRRKMPPLLLNHAYRVTVKDNDANLKTFRTIAIAGIVSFIVSAAAYAQGYSIKGKIIDLNRSPLPGALVRLIDPGDSTRAYVTSTNLDGAFMFSGVPQQTYTLRVTAVGKRTLNVVLRPAGNILDIGSLAISDEPIHVRGVTVEGRIPAAVQVGDTTEYAANAVKVNRDATMED
ncbi:MAG: hypothetical protein B7Z63_04690, partial [Ignavibacteriae bacterium 37-53-5]